MSKLSDRKKAYDEFIKSQNELIWNDFVEDLKLLFEKYPHIESFETPAYAPYFSDGDSCIYSVNYDLSRMNLKEEEKDEYEDDEDNEVYCEVRQFKKLENGEYYYFTPEKYKPLEEYVDLISLVPESLIEERCEDGVIVFYRSGNISVDDYSHD